MAAGIDKKFHEFLELIEKGKTQEVKNLVIGGFNARQYDDHATVVAAQFNRAKILDFLIERGADIHKNEERALRTAVKHGAIPVVKLLLRNDADIHIKNDAALEYAVEKQNTDMIILLLSNGAVPNKSTIENMITNDMQKVIDVFIELGKGEKIIEEIKKQEKYNLLPDKKESSLTLADTLSFLTILKAEDARLSLCDINTDNSIVKAINSKLLKKESASNAVNVFTDIVLNEFTLPISLKIFINSGYNAGLVYESKLYREILSRIIQYDYSPNFVSYVGFAECDVSSVVNYGKKSDQKENTLEKQIPKRLLKNDTKVCLLATERVGNGSMFGYNKMLPVYTLRSIVGLLESQKEKDNILFQICYSLHLMQQFKIVHNDMHADNLLVMALPEKVQMTFTIGEKSYLIDTKYIPYLFDWDFGYMEALGENEHTKQYPFIFNHFSKKADLYTVLCTLDVFINNDMDEFFQKYPNAKAKEKGTVVDITDEEIARIQQYRIFAQGDGDIYKFSYAQFDEMFPGTFSPDIMHVFVELFPSKRKLKIYTGYACRQTIVSKNFPTPLEYIEKYLFEFEISPDELAQKNVLYNYKIPTSQELIVL